ncbi:MAG: hypothetical protein IPM99_26755 [Rubrivivax sp.]|nr:hypothetical protein [Rubrivivax sp.]
MPLDPGSRPAEGLRRVHAAALRQNRGEMLDLAHHRNDSALLERDGKPVAALIDA